MHYTEAALPENLNILSSAIRVTLYCRPKKHPPCLRHSQLELGSLGNVPTKDGEKIELHRSADRIAAAETEHCMGH